jgi:hypothetical protein
VALFGPTARFEKTTQLASGCRLGFPVRAVGGAHNDLPDSWMQFQCYFDFTQLDPMAPDLSLVIDPAEKLEIGFWRVTQQILGPVKARAEANLGCGYC